MNGWPDYGVLDVKSGGRISAFRMVKKEDYARLRAAVDAAMPGSNEPMFSLPVYLWGRKKRGYVVDRTVDIKPGHVSQLQFYKYKSEY